MARSCTFALVLMLGSVALAQVRAPAFDIVEPMHCATVAFSTPVMSSIRARDVGGGDIEADLFMVAGGPATHIGTSQLQGDVSLRLDVPEGEQVCTMRIRLRGVGAGARTLHLIAPNAHVAGPMGHRPGSDGEIARTTVTVR